MYIKSFAFITAFIFTLLSNPVQKLSDLDNYGSMMEDKDASFPGGSSGWAQFLKKNLKANTPIKRKAPVGRYQVVIKFEIFTDGSLINIEPITNFGYGMEEEAVRVISKSPNWIPASQNGKPVIAKRMQPITFVVPK